MDPIALTRTLVLIPSPTGEEGPIGEWIAAFLEERGWRVTRQPVSPGRFNVYATLGPPVVVLSTHLDVVPPDLAFVEDEEFLWGRGTCDAKGIAAAMVAAAERLRIEGEDRVGLLFLVGEENGSDGARAAGALAPKGRFLINGEPTENLLSIGQKGALRVTLTASGRAAHSAYPEEGESAVNALLDALERIRALPLPADPLLGRTTLNIGRIEGGVAPNVIPDVASAELLVRLVGPSAPLRHALEAAAGQNAAVEFSLEIPALTAPRLDGWETTTVRFTSDLPLLTDWGVGYQLGPGSILVAHTSEERIRKTDLLAGTEHYVALIRHFLALESSPA